MKAVDDTSGSIVGMAKWNIFINYIPNLAEPNGKKGDHWENEEQKAYAEYVAQAFLADRRDAIVMSKGNLVSLDMLAVDPAH